MPPRAWRMRIEDIVEASSAIAEYVQGLTYEYFGVDLTILWKTASIDLPAILPALRGVIESS